MGLWNLAHLVLYNSHRMNASPLTPCDFQPGQLGHHQSHRKRCIRSGVYLLYYPASRRSSGIKTTKKRVVEIRKGIMVMPGVRGKKVNYMIKTGREYYLAINVGR